MRKLASVHELANSPQNIWEISTGFVAYLLIPREEEKIREFVEKYWIDYDLKTGDYLFVVVTALLPERDDEEDLTSLLEREEKITSEILEKFNLNFGRLPCMVFMEGPESDRCFCYDLGGSEDGPHVREHFKKIFAACKKHWPGLGKPRSKDGFNALHQELRAIKWEQRIGPIVNAMLPKVFLTLLGKF